MHITKLEIAVDMFLGMLIGVIFHELMHGYVAYRMGDTTAKRAGRLTLDPLAHIDPFGTVILPGMLLLLSLMGSGTFIIGYAKPVPVNPFFFRKPRGIIYVSLAGPLTNLAIGVVFFGLLRILTLFEAGSFIYHLVYACLFIAHINLLLCVFNLIPIPPLDGSRIVAYFLRGDARRLYQSIEPYGFVLILLLVFVFGYVLSDIVGGLANIILRVYGLSPIF